MKILLVGNVDFSKRLLKKLFMIGAPILGVITKESSNFNSDHVNLSILAKQYGVPCLCVKDINAPESLAWAGTLGADVCFCFGFSQLLSKEFLALFSNGAIGYHPSALPCNRGRHPIIWSLALGLKETASTFFFLTILPDEGDIINQVLIPIAYEDDAQSLYDKLALEALTQIEKICSAGDIKSLKHYPQILSRGNIWRKRTKEDGKIDFRMSSQAVYNLVRALTRPYGGAHFSSQGQDIKVWKVREENVACNNWEPGRILEVKNGHVLVKCYDNAIWLVQHEFLVLPKTGEYLL